MLKYALMIILLLGLVLNFQIPLEAQNYRPGYCPITNKRIINSMGRTLPNYRIVWFELNNGSRMPLAVDKSANITSADFEQIMEHVRDGWMYEFSKIKMKPEQVRQYKEQYFNLKIKGLIE